MKKVPFIPALKTGGLGLSTFVQENGKTLEENDVERTVQQAAKYDILAGNAPGKRPMIPMLKTGNLGLSTIVKENGLTAEE